MAKRINTLSDVESNLESTAKALKEVSDSSISIVDLLKAQHSLMCWVFAHGSSFIQKVLRDPDIKFVEPFWSLCSHYGFELTEEQKQEIFQDFLED